MSRTFVVNGRFTTRPMTGVERYAQEISSRFSVPSRNITPIRPLNGLLGHLWEQVALPVLAKGRLLWSPCNTGPIAVANQVLTLHDIAVLEHPEWFTPNFVRLYRELLPKLVKRVRHLVTVSEYSRKRIIEKLRVNPDRVTVIPNGVSEQFCPKSEAEIIAVRRKYAIPAGPLLLTLGSREPRKNHGRILAAWGNVSKRIPEASLVIAGGGGAAHIFDCGSRIGTVDRVVYTGYIDAGDLPALYSAATAFLYPSLYEGFGLPVLESLACGTPVLTSNNSSLGELVGGRMVVVDPLSICDLERGMIELLSDGTARADVAQQCCTYARKYSWQTAAAATEEILLQYSL